MVRIPVATLGLSALLAVTAGCGTIAVTPSTAPVTATSTPTQTHSPSPSGKPAPTTSPSPTPSAVTDLSLEIHELPVEYTQDVSDVISLGNEIIWAARAPGRNGHWYDQALYRYAPNDSHPEVIYLTTPGEMHPIGYIAGSSAGYVFSDYVGSETLTGKWRVWFVSGPGEEPLKLDEGDDEPNNDFAPIVAMNDRYIAWAGLRGAGERRVTELKVVRVGAFDQIMTVTAPRVDFATVYEPALFESELWYSFSDNDWERNLAYPRLEMLDINELSATPFVLGKEVRAGMAAPGGRVVVFKSGGVAEDNPQSMGLLTIYWRDTQTIEQLRIPGHPQSVDRASYPSVGDRFVAWRDDVKSRLYVYDLTARSFARVAELDPTYRDGLFPERSVGGNLLAFVYANDDGTRVRWAFLPD